MSREELEELRRGLVMVFLPGFPPSNSGTISIHCPYKPKWNYWIDQRQRREWGMLK